MHIGGADEPAYVCSNAGVNALTGHVATMWGKRNIRANAIDERPSHIRLPRLGEADDVAAPIAFLLSDDGAWVTGQVWAVDGGHTLRE